MSRRLAAGLLAVVVLVSAIALFLRRGGEAHGPFPGAPIVVISIDTLRADRLPAYGYAKGRTPAIDRLAHEGITFEDVYSHCPLTLPAHASLFTGLLPPRHGVRDNAGFALDRAHATLASRFRAAGMETGGAVSAYVLRRATGIAEGFDLYDDAIETDARSGALGEQQRDGAVAVEALSGWIAARGRRRFFAFLHLYEPHSPWTPPPAHRALPSPYDGEVAYADELVGRFLDRLRAASILDHAIVVLTSDHGEGLGDHGEEEHGLFLYREAVRVPLIVRLPGAAGAGRRVAGAIAQADIPATLLDLAGIAAPSGLDGTSQRAALVSGKAEARPVYSETLFPRYHFGWSELLAVTEGRLRYIHAPRPELYDLGTDPAERTNLVAERADAARGMAAWVQARAGSGAPPAPADVPADVRERLEALGYVGGSSAPPTSGPLADPKDHVATYEEFRKANELRRAGRDAEAATLIERVLAKSPGMVDAREMLGETLFRVGRVEEARAAYAKVLETDPERASTHLALARLHAALGRLDLVERHAAQATARQPGEAYELLAQASLGAARLDEAVRFARHAVEADPTRAVAHFVIGRVARAQGRCDEALAALARAHDARSRQREFVIPGLYASMGDCLARLGREAEAERAFRAEIEQVPHSVEGRTGLAILHRSGGRLAAAREAVAGIVTAHPRPGPEEYWTVVRTLRGLEDEEAAAMWALRARERFPADRRFR